MGFNPSVQSERRSVVVPFRKYVVYTGGVTASRISDLAVPSSALGDRITEIGDNFLHWRFRRLRVTSTMSGGGTTALVPLATSPVTFDYSSNGIVHMIAFAMVDKSKITGTPTTEQATQLPCFKMGNGFQQIRFDVPPSVLVRAGAVPWFETETTGSESGAFQIPGCVWSASVIDHTTDGDLSQHILIEGDIEFRDPCDSTISLLRPRVPLPLPSPPSAADSADQDDDFAEYLKWKEWQSLRSVSGKHVAAIPPP